MLRKIIYPKIEGLLNRIGSWLHQKGFSPNQLTIAGLALNFLAGYLYATGQLQFGALMLIVAGLGDALDGPLARVSNRVTSFGAFLDSTLDRYSDFFLFGGLALYFARLGEGGLLILTLGILAGGFVVSYSKARAENLIDSCSVGVFDRIVRLVLLALGTLLPVILPVMLWVLFLGANATAVQRILYTKKKLDSPVNEDPL